MSGHLTVCEGCGQLKGCPEHDAGLWDVYSRIPVEREEPLVWIPGEDFDPYDDDDRESMTMATENNMYRRGLCPVCGRPDLARCDTSNLMSDDEREDWSDYLAEVAAERRMGC
jgi:hypothetical protein